MSKKVLEYNQKAVEALKIPIACVGGELFTYRPGMGWLSGDAVYDDWIMHELGQVPSNISMPRRIRFNVPLGVGGLATDARYMQWSYDEDDTFWGGIWQPLRLRPTEVVFENCIVDFKSGEVTARNQMTHPIYGPIVSAPYNPDATHKDWEKVLEKFLPNPDFRAYAQEVLSLVLIPHHFAKALVLLVGPSNTGKSTLASAVSVAPGGMAGVTSCNPDLAANRPFDAFALVGKFAALCEELEHLSPKGKTWLKAYSGGNFSWEVKFGVRGSSAPTAKFIGCSNGLPDFIEHSKAMHNRMVLLPLMEEITKGMREDMSTTSHWAHPSRRKAVLAWLSHGLTRLANRHFQLEPPGFVEELREQVRISTNPILRWLADNLEFTGEETDRVASAQVLETMRRDGVKVTEKELRIYMAEAYPDAEACKKCKPDRRGRWMDARGYAGLRMER